MDKATAEVYLKTLFEENDVFEIRVLGAKRDIRDSRTHVESGYFTYETISTAVQEIANLASYTGVYVTINPVKSELLSRSPNRLGRAKSGQTTSDKDILKRRWLFIDIDPVRPAGVCATVEEKEKVQAKMEFVREGLATMGFCPPIAVDSGNGEYLLYKIDVPAEDNGLIKRCLQSLTSVNDDYVDIDVSVSNAGRIVRVAGTINCKGTSSDDRPHRRSKILFLPQAIETTPSEALEGLAIPAAQETEIRPWRQPSVGTQNKLTFKPTQSPISADYNQRADVPSLLAKHGWTFLSVSGDNQYWRRPGKNEGEHSATWNGRHFYVFSSNSILPQGQAYTPFKLYSVFEHGGNDSAAFSSLESQGFGVVAQSDNPDMSEVDISAIIEQCNGRLKTQREQEIIFPSRLMDVPGFIGDVLDYTYHAGAVVNEGAALAGAVTLQAVLAGRVTQFEADGYTRTNLYMIALAGSATGKNQPRTTNLEIMNKVADRVEVEKCNNTIKKMIRNKFASGQAIVKCCEISPSVLFQVDEMDKLLKQLSIQGSSRAIEIEQQILELYSMSGTTYNGDARADDSMSIRIEQPNMCIFGTATPGVFYESLSLDSLRNGFVGRILPIEYNKPKRRLTIREKRAQQTDRGIPAKIIDVATYWAAMHDPDWDKPIIDVDITDDAVDILDAAGATADTERVNAVHDFGEDCAESAIWGRYNENRNKLAMIYACSADYRKPVITADAAKWACELTEYSCRLMIKAIRENVADSACHKLALQIKKKVAREMHKSRCQWVKHRDVKRIFGVPAREFNDALQLLVEREEMLIRDEVGSTGQVARLYTVKP